MRAIVTALALLAATPALSADIFAASGAWLGEGQLATGAERALQRGRCRVEVTPAEREVSVTGTCVVAAGASDISLKLVRGAGGHVNAGFWSAATDQVVQFAGTETDGAMVLTSTSPLEVEGQVYESRVELSAPDAAGFTLRQMLRAPGEEAWRLVVDMSYRPAG